MFLSFRGGDTRECFTKKLYESLHSEGVRVFMDDEGLDRGDRIDTTLLQAIDDSAASIVIISTNYADSHWCLDELVRIFESKRLVIPVFLKLILLMFVNSPLLLKKVLLILKTGLIILRFPSGEML